MSLVVDGLPASEGLGIGRIRRVRWEIPPIPRDPLPPAEAAAEVTRFHEARAVVRARLEQIRADVERRLGPMEAGIFDVQLLMLDDSSVVDGTEAYIRDHHLRAPRAFRLQMMEHQALWMGTGSSFIMDRLNDLEDIQVRMLHHLLGLPEPGVLAGDAGAVILSARNFTPTLVVQLDPSRVVGLAADLGTRTSHWAILARSLGIPAVVGLVDLSDRGPEGVDAILDGRVGRVVVDPTPRDRAVYEMRRIRIFRWEEELAQLAQLDSVTEDGHPVTLRANLDVPAEAHRARDHGAEGVGLFRTEFLVVGRSAMPGEQEQYESYRHVVEAFPNRAVFIRTYDLGGDKFPTFLQMPAEENPFLGWRAIRVCLDRLELFRPQLRAILRATAHGDLRILLPLVNDVEEVVRVRELLAEEEANLKREGIPFSSGYKLGILIETPAAALDAAELARHCDFFSIGTNDLVQYTLAVDRTNARLSSLYNPFHPAVVRQLHMVARAGRAAGIEVSICGELAANPLGAFLAVGLDIHALSVSWPAIPEIKKVIRSVRAEDARRAARQALSADTAREVASVLAQGIGRGVDLAAFSGRWNLFVPESGSA
jgi:phosphoenolpyruvate-protein phosphotransferase (PTS system enzyme I)